MGGVLIAVEWAVWLTLLLVPVAAAAVAVAGPGILLPMATVKRVRRKRWPRWTTRALGYGIVGLVVAAPAAWLLVRVVSE